MQSRIYNLSIGYCLFGIAMWFFGNLYEAISIAPNMLANSYLRMQAWQAFFVSSNPIIYYVPLTVIAAVMVPVLWVKTTAQATDLKQKLRTATMSIAIALATGIYMIVQINTKIFLGDVQTVANLHSLCIEWSVLNIIRLVFTGMSLIKILQAYILTRQLAKKL